jgi:hypothetical protein
MVQAEIVVMSICATYGDSNYLYGDTDRLYSSTCSEDVVRWGIEVDWNGDGLYSGDSENAYAIFFRTRRGRQTYLDIDSDGNANGFEPARVGTATLILDNTSRRYDPYNTGSDLYPYVLPARYVRVRQLYQGTVRDVFHGKIRTITSIDDERKQQVRLELEDGLRNLQAADSNVAIQQSITVSDAITDVLEDVDYPSIFGTNIETADDTLDYWWAEDKAATEIRRLAEAELGNFFVAADGNATFYSRHHSAAAALTLTSADFLKEIDVPQPLEVIRNVIKLYAHPLTLASTSVLWTLADTPLISAGRSLEVWATYTSNNEEVPALNVVSPQSSTDYTMNTAADGSGSDLTGSFSVSFTDFGKTGKITITNNHGSLAGYVTLMQVRGDAIVSPNVSLLIQEDAASQAIYGKTLLRLDNEWYQNTSLANDFTRWLISYMPNPQKFLTVRVETRPDIQFTPDLFDIINVTINRLSISDVNYRVAGIEHNWLTDNGQAVRTEWILEPNPDLSGYWQFDIENFGVDTVFGI